jgi:serine/threonine protein phosphatase 1
MLRRLTNLFGNRGAHNAPPPLLGTLYAVADIHGHAAKLQILLQRIAADAVAQPGPITLVCLGDYLNRGPASAQVLQTLRHQLPAAWQTVFLRGNHEQKLLEFLAHPHQHSEWLGWGGTETCLSYGVKPYGATGLRPAAAVAAELQLALEESGDLAWLQATRLHYQAAPYTFVHAGVRPGLALAEQLPEDLLYIREDWLNRPHGLPGVVVFGHTIFPQPLQTPDRLGLDTGAYQHGPLTAARLTATQPPTFLQTT